MGAGPVVEMPELPDARRPPAILRAAGLAVEVPNLSRRAACGVALPAFVMDENTRSGRRIELDDQRPGRHRREVTFL
jgi:hypothetical protein